MSETKQYLYQIKDLKRRIQNKQEEVEQLRSFATSISSPGTVEYVQASGSGDKLGSIVAKIVDTQSEIDMLVEKYPPMLSEFLTTLMKLSQQKYHDVLLKKYVELKMPKEISGEMNYSLNHVLRITREAAEEVKKIKGFKD